MRFGRREKKIENGQRTNRQINNVVLIKGIDKETNNQLLIICLGMILSSALWLLYLVSMAYYYTITYTKYVAIFDDPIIVVLDNLTLLLVFAIIPFILCVSYKNIRCQYDYLFRTRRIHVECCDDDAPKPNYKKMIWENITASKANTAMTLVGIGLFVYTIIQMQALLLLSEPPSGWQYDWIIIGFSLIVCMILNGDRPLFYQSEMYRKTEHEGYHRWS